MQVRDVVIDGTTFKGIEIPLPNAVMVMVTADKGYLMCGYLSIEAAEKLGDRAAIVTGVKNVDEILAGRVVKVTTAAAKAGITTGMAGREALSRLR